MVTRKCTNVKHFSGTDKNMQLKAYVVRQYYKYIQRKTRYIIILSAMFTSTQRIWTSNSNVHINSFVRNEHVRPAVAHHFWGMKLSLPMALSYQNLTGQCKES